MEDGKIREKWGIPGTDSNPRSRLPWFLKDQANVLPKRFFQPPLVKFATVTCNSGYLCRLVAGGMLVWFCEPSSFSVDDACLGRMTAQHTQAYWWETRGVCTVQSLWDEKADRGPFKSNLSRPSKSLLIRGYRESFPSLSSTRQDPDNKVVSREARKLSGARNVYMYVCRDKYAALSKDPSFGEAAESQTCMQQAQPANACKCTEGRGAGRDIQPGSLDEDEDGLWPSPVLSKIIFANLASIKQSCLWEAGLVVMVRGKVD